MINRRQPLNYSSPFLLNFTVYAFFLLCIPFFTVYTFFTVCTVPFYAPCIYFTCLLRAERFCS